MAQREEIVMDERDETLIKTMLEPIAEITKESYLKAMILRIDVFKCVAVDNGAELEDLPLIIANAIETAQPIVTRFLDDLSELETAQKIGERK
jgi:hypothetical protein